MALKNFDGAVAVITGGASGIGLATARSLYSEGAHVILADINEPGLQQAARQVKESNLASMGHVVAAKTDVSCVPLLSAYCASKWAIRGFSSALRAELYGTGIGITTVYPSWVDTPMTQQEGLQLLNIEVKLTAEQVAGEILQAILQERSDLTLAPDNATALLLQIMQDNPDKAEQLMGQSFQQRFQQIFGTQA